MEVFVLCVLVVLYFKSLLGGVSSEVFSSTAQLKLLFGAETEVTGMLTEYLQQEEIRLHKITDLIPTLERSAGSNVLSMGHPVNAYHLVKRWYQLSKLASGVGESPEFQQFVTDHGLQMPTEPDYIGAAAALLRLQSTYSLTTADFAKGKVFDEYSDEPLYPDDCFLLGDVATKNSDFGLAAQWFDMATRSTDPNFPLADTYLRLARLQQTIGDMEAAVAAVKMAEEHDPTNSTIKAEMWSYISQLEQLQKENSEHSVNMSTWMRFLPDWKANYEALCRGDHVYRPPEVLASLTCRYKPGLLPYVVYKEETLSWDPRISMFYDVISNNDADLIKQLATPLLFRAVVGDPSKAYETDERVSKVAFLWDTDANHGSSIKRLSEQVEDITGLETEYRPELSSSEPFQVVNYGIGGQYEPHVDYYEDVELRKSIPSYVLGTGDRMVTFMFYNESVLFNVPNFLQGTGDRISNTLFYMSDIKYGGATVFPQIGVRVPPIKNAAAFWYNVKPSGTFDGNTQHAGCPVLVGEKWVANKWIREFGQEFRRPCALREDALWDV